MGFGEEICDGVCVNTQEDDENCGMCNVACDENNSEWCIDGECKTVFPPYGAPMPEPLWV